MARVNPIAPTNPPSPAIQRGDRATFAPRVDATITYLTGAPAEIYGLAQASYTNALDAFFSAGSAAGSATAASTSAGEAAGSATAAATSASQAAGSAGAAATSATNAASSATALTATSVTSLGIGTGTKSFTVQAGKQFVPGIDVKVVDSANPANAMYGTVASYAGTALLVNVTSYVGGGTKASWNISVAGPRGDVGPEGGVNLPALHAAVLSFKG